MDDRLADEDAEDHQVSFLPGINMGRDGEKDGEAGHCGERKKGIPKIF